MDETKSIEEKIQVHKEVLDRLNKIAEEYELENIIKDNIIEFDYGDAKYRIRKMTLQEREYANKERNRFYISLVKDKDCMFRDQWIALYKEKGIDIRKMDSDTAVIQSEIEQFLLGLATAKSDSDVEMFRKNIDAKRMEQAAIINKKGDLLEFSIEDQLNVFMNTLLVTLMAERVESGGRGVRLYKNLDEIKNEKNISFLTTLYRYTNMLAYNDDL